MMLIALASMTVVEMAKYQLRRMSDFTPDQIASSNEWQIHLQIPVLRSAEFQNRSRESGPADIALAIFARVVSPATVVEL